MSRNVVIASPDGTFGELLRISLEENGGYLVQLVKTSHDLLTLAAEGRFDLAIVDAGIAGDSAADLINLLMAQHPILKVVVIPLENNPQHPSMIGCRPQAYLYRPFFLPDLYQTLDLVLQAASLKAKPGVNEPSDEKPNSRMPIAAGMDAREIGQARVNVPAVEKPPDPGTPSNGQPRLLMHRLVQELEDLVREPEIFAAVIAGRGQVLAYTGQLNKTEADTLALTLSSKWNPASRGDLIYFGQLSDKQNVLYYSVVLSDVLTLTVIYDSDQRISAARRRTGQAARILREHIDRHAPEALSTQFGRLLDDYSRITQTDLQEKGLPSTSTDPAGRPGNGWAPYNHPTGI